MEGTLFQEGIYTEKQLVDLFGSDAIKDSYSRKGHFIGTQKNTLLKTIRNHCIVKELKNRRYRIKKVHLFPVPSNFSKMNKSLYQYTIPLLLNIIVKKNSEKESIDMTLSKWGNSIGLVNQNYTLTKYNKQDTSLLIEQPENIVVEFFDKLKSMVTWYVLNSFDYLRDAGLIEWYEVSHIVKEVTIKDLEIDQYGNINTNLKLDSRKISKEEMTYYTHCVDIADKAAGIEDIRERYYSDKSAKFVRVLKEELYKKNIKRVYDTYEIHCTSLVKCKFVLNLFGEFNEKKLISQLSKEFIKMIIENAEKRYDKNPLRYTRYPTKKEYIDCFKQLCEIAIDCNTEDLKGRIKDKSIFDEYTLRFGKE